MSQSLTSAVFVYGTLRRGQLRESQWPQQPITIARGFIQAALYDLGPYPAVTSGSDFIAGEIWQFSEKQMHPTLEVLDQIEGYIPGRSNNLYERVVVDVYSDPYGNDRDIIQAFAYMMESRKLPRSATRIQPQPDSDFHQALVCRWPVQNEPPNITSARPDPFPDDVAE